jgi:prepilin signal peptidase PulO-like enzyme (type II secretory pathway)
LRGTHRFSLFRGRTANRFFFLLIWKAFPWPIAIAYWIFIALVIAATFIDFEHFIIPDEITIGGTGCRSDCLDRSPTTDESPIAV